MSDNGLISRRSTASPAEAMSRFIAIVTAKGMTVFARIDHAAAAAKAGLALRPTEVAIFGSAQGGTPLMQASQTIGIDLPLKVLVWQDEAGTTWISYNDPVWIASRHDPSRAHSPAVLALSQALATIVGLSVA